MTLSFLLRSPNHTVELPSLLDELASSTSINTKNRQKNRACTNHPEYDRDPVELPENYLEDDGESSNGPYPGKHRRDSVRVPVSFGLGVTSCSGLSGVVFSEVTTGESGVTFVVVAGRCRHINNTCGRLYTCSGSVVSAMLVGMD